jgi:hypothetical protein
MYFIFMYENKRMKPVEIVLRRGKGEKGGQRDFGGGKSN